MSADHVAEILERMYAGDPPTLEEAKARGWTAEELDRARSLAEQDMTMRRPPNPIKDAIAAERERIEEARRRGP